VSTLHPNLNPTPYTLTPHADASAVKNEVFLSGSCKSAGFRGSAWQFNNHFLLIDGIGGYFGGPVTLCVWFRLLQAPSAGQDALILGIGVRGAVLNMGIVVAAACASECVILPPTPCNDRTCSVVGLRVTCDM